MLKTLATYELLSTAQICDLVFPGIDKRTVLRRLRKLARERVVVQRHGLPRGELVWWLTSFGAHTIHKDDFMATLNRSTLDHDVALNQVRIALERGANVSSWVTEQRMRRRYETSKQTGYFSLIPDAIVAVKTATGFEAVAVELELTGKNVSRYKKVLDSYRCMKQFWSIWYIVTAPALGAKILKVWGDVIGLYGGPRFGWLLLDEVLANPMTAIVHEKDRELQMSEVLAPPSPSQNALPTPALTAWAPGPR